MGKWKNVYNDGRAYNKSWELEFKWLSWQNNGCFCKWCQCNLSNMRKSAFEQHEKTAKHRKVQESFTKSKKITDAFKTSPSSPKKELKEFEIKYSVSAACHCSVRSVDHSSELIAKYGKGSILENVKLHRTKCMALLKNVVSLAFFEDLIDDLKDSKYSLLIDESTDVSVTKLLCMCVKYFSKREKRVQTSFLGIIPVISTTGESLFNAITTFLSENNIDIRNCIGLGTDGANNVSGEVNSVFSRFRNLIPNIKFIKCTCHSLALCCEKAFNVLPTNLNFLISEIPRWFHLSALRRDDFRKIYATMNDGSEQHEKFVTPSTTRWLVRGKCISIILKQWEELQAYFCSVVDRNYNARLIKEMLNDEVNKLYLTFALPIIQNFESLNAAFQASNPDASKLFKELEDLRNFLLQKVYRDPHDRKICWAPNDRKLGEKFEYDLKCSSLVPEKKLEIQRRCRDVLLEAINQIDKRLDNTTMKMEYIKYLNPKICLSQVRPRFHDLPLEQLAKEQNFDVMKVANQYEQIAMKKDWREEFPGSDIPTNPVEFWSYVFDYENAAGEKCYRELATIVLDTYCIPLSTAFVERVFSHVTNVKTKARNKLSVSSLESILRIRSHLFVHNLCCQNFEVTDRMLSLFTNEMYKRDCRGTMQPDNPQPSSSASICPSSTTIAADDSEAISFEEILSFDF